MCSSELTTQLVNDNLKWQRSRQFEVAAEMKIGQINVSLSAYHNKSKNGYTTNTHYTPFTYKYTNQSAIEGTNIPAADRRYKVDQQTGIVTMYDINGVYDSQELAYGERLTLKSDSYAANTSPVKRQGLEWVVDFGRIKSLNTSFRYDGSFYHYRGINENLISYMPVSTQNMSNGMPYK